MGIERTRRFVYLALFSAMAIVLSIIESIYIGPVFFMVRIGLANIVALVTVKILGVKEMIIVNIMRVVISTLMRGMIFSSTFWISLGGVALSSIVLILMEKAGSTLMFTSVIMSIAHSVGQVIVVCFFYMQAGVAAILPYLLLGSIPMGFLTGITARLVLARIKPLKKQRE
jgi:heptaprenyl diphosphate synthase